MDLDFGLLQQINADMDGFPVRFDDDMDILDLENVLHAPVPGSFQDFAAWLADNSGTLASVRNPESSGANADCRDKPVTLGLLDNPQQYFGASNAVDGVQLVSEPNLPISNLQQQHTQQQQQQQQQPTHFHVMRQNSAHSVHSQPSPGAGHHAHHAPPTAHDSFRSAHSCNAAGLPEASVLLQQNSPQQQQQEQQMQQQGSGLLAAGWGLPSQPQQPQQQQTPQQQQAAAASAALSAAANKAQQLLLSTSSGFGAPPAAAAVPSTAGFLSAQQPQHTAGVSLALGGASFSTAGFPAMSPAGSGALLLSPHGAVLQPVLIGGSGSAVFPAYSVAGMGGMALGPQHMQQGYALHGAHAAAGLALHQSALHSLVGHGVAKHTAMERQQK